jgi:arylsulfatase A-like enzyme
MIVALFSYWFLAHELPADSNPNDATRLVVLLVFDQMRADYLTRWQSLFEEGGLRRLQDEGAWFQNCHYPYAYTVTGTGHASLLTGCNPAVHGIVGNNWYDRDLRKIVNCVRGKQVYQQIGEPGLATPAYKKSGACPDQLKAPTVADHLKKVTHGKARVVSLSLKDRSAILPVGGVYNGWKPDACYWFDTSSGAFETSSYYRNRIHPWVSQFNREGIADRWFNQSWTRLRPLLEYERYSGPDDVPAEGRGFNQGRTFPHPMNAGLAQPGTVSREALTFSPFGNELLLALAKRAIDAEKLGQRDVPDLLSLSFSSNDFIGHVWGPDSQEVLDVTLRTDRIVKELLDYLDTKVGKNRYLVALTADHGICPIPELARSHGLDAGRIEVAALKQNAEEFLNLTFGKVASRAGWFESVSNNWVFLNRSWLQQNQLVEAEVANVLADRLKQQPGILTAYTRTQLLENLPAEDWIGAMVRSSFYPARCGEVVVVQKPYYLFSGDFSTGTNHGTPHAYDTHVPLLIYGPEILRGVYQEAVAPQAIAAIFSRSLNIAAPDLAEFSIPTSLTPGK